MSDPLPDNDKKEAAGPDQKPQPDYYIENGMLVFTEAYHLRRGQCCKSGCRHCPYGFRKKK